MRCFKIVFIFFLLITCQMAQGLESPLKDFNFGLGNLSQFLRRIQTDDQGDHNGLEFNPFLGAELRFDFSSRWSVAPEFGITLPSEGRDPNITKLTYWMSASLGYSIGDYILQLGAGLFMNRVSAEGGTQELPNGASYDNFPVPDGSATATNLTTHAGLRYYFLPRWSAKTQLHFYNVEDSDERSLSLLFMVSYHVGDFLGRIK